MRVWGFDVGTTSIGFAVIDYDPDRQSGRIERLGVRIFPEGVTEEKGEPRNKERRAKRIMRRQLRRKRWRRRALHEALARVGLLPAADPAQWPTGLAQADPYDLRDKGLREKLALHEVGRALFHMLKRRGFQSARMVTAAESNKQKDEEEGIVKAEIDRIATELNGHTVGQWLRAQPKRRGHHTGRSMTAEEFERFWATQAAHRPGILTEALKATIHDIAFRQRPIFWRLKTLGECSLEPGEPLCPKGSWRGQQFEMLQTLNNLRLAGGNARPLEPDERLVLWQALETSASLSFGAARTLLKPLWQKSGTPLRTKFNFEVEGGKKLLPGNRLEADLREIFGPAWQDHPRRDAIRIEVFDRLRDVNYRRLGNKRMEIRGAKEVELERERFIAAAQQDWEITRAQAEKLAAIEPPAAWLHLSEAAIDKLMPLLEGGKPYGEARLLLYPPPHAEGGGAKKLSSDQGDLPVQRNPTVMRCLNELRKVTNNLIETYGRPERIRIELARDVALGGKSKRDYLETISRRELQRRTAAKRLTENGFPANDRNVLKWLLWQECRETCPYTLDRIGFGDLFGDHPKYDIEHIWPRSVSLDNSFANKTLCRRDVNAKKGSNTPFKFYRSNHGIADLPDWEEVSTFMRKLVEDRNMPRSKARRFLHDGDVVKSDERLIGDTAYIAREARKWLATLMPRGEYDVETRNGRLVSRLRKLWNLNWLLGPDGEKNRTDHRHHALDAAATALFDTAAMQQIVKWFKHKEQNPDLEPPAIPLPWPSLHDDLRKALDAIVVSHRVRRKVNGPLHDETRLGVSSEPPIRDGGKDYRFYVKRKVLAQMSKGEIEAIRDERIRALAQERLATFDGDIKKAFATPLMLPGRTGKPDREIKKARILIKLQEGMVVPAGNGNGAVAERGDVHHYALYRLPDGKVDYATVSRFEAMRRNSKKLPLTEKRREDGAILLFTLAPGDMLKITRANKPPEYLVVRKTNAAGRVFIKPHILAGIPKPEVSFGPERLVQPDITKVSVDPIGHVRPARG